MTGVSHQLPAPDAFFLTGFSILPFLIKSCFYFISLFWLRLCRRNMLHTSLTWGVVNKVLEEAELQHTQAEFTRSPFFLPRELFHQPGCQSWRCVTELQQICTEQEAWGKQNNIRTLFSGSPRCLGIVCYFSIMYPHRYFPTINGNPFRVPFT
jgi:hypothetical protein